MSATIYVPLADVSAACGVSAHALLTRYWPEDWAVPRDWRMMPRSSVVLVAEAALPALGAELRRAGLAAEAERLGVWCAELATPEPHEDFMARHHAPTREAREPWWKKGQFA